MRYRVGELVDSISKKCDFKTDKIIFLNTGDIEDGKIVNNNCYKISDLPGQAKKKIKNGDILFSEIRPKNKRYALVENIDETNYVVSTKLMVLRNKDSKVLNMKYFYYFLTSPKMLRYLQSEAEARSGTFPQITFKDNIYPITINLPSLAEQNKIVKNIDSIVNKIKNNQKINTNLLQLSQIMFKNKFPNVNDGPDKIGAYIRNYDKDRKPLSKKQRSKMPGKYRYIGATSVNDYIAKYNFDGIYLLLGEDGTVQDINGYPVLQYIHGKFWPNNHAHVLQGNKVSTEWLYLFFLQRNIEGIITGAVQKKISQKNLNSLSVTMPNNEELSKFDNIIQPIFEQIRTLEEENERLLEIKKELLTNLF